MSIQLLGTKYTLGGRTLYDTAFKFRALGKMVDLDRIGGPDNRPTDRSHVRGIKSYLQVEKRPILGTLLLAATHDQITFDSLQEDDGVEVGVLKIADDVLFEVSDGQHRTLALMDACKEADHYAYRAGSLPDFCLTDRVGVTIVVENDRMKRRQDWHDINDTPKAANKSVAMAFDTRSPIGKLVRAVMNQVPIFHDDLIEDRANAVKKADARKLYTANNVGTALTAFVLGSTRKGKTQAERELDEKAGIQEKFQDVRAAAVEYFTALSVMPGWKEVLELGDRITPEETLRIREGYVHLSGLGLNILGVLGSQCDRNGWDVAKFAHHLATDIDWRRENGFWHGVILIPREVEGESGPVTTYGIARGGDVIDEAVRLVLERLEPKGFPQKLVAA
jgi:DGQHR domain-containing protein